jgi:hypothetical protein
MKNRGKILSSGALDTHFAFMNYQSRNGADFVLHVQLVSKTSTTFVALAVQKWKLPHIVLERSVWMWSSLSPLLLQMSFHELPLEKFVIFK